MTDQAYLYVYYPSTHKLEHLFGRHLKETFKAELINIINKQSDRGSSGIILSREQDFILLFLFDSFSLILGVPYVLFMEAIIGTPEFNRLFTLGTLVGKISHEFNNILTGLLGHSSYLCELSDDPDLKKSGEFIKDGIEKSILLTKELVLFSKPSSRKERISVNSLFERLKLWIKIIVPAFIRVQFDNQAEEYEFETDSVKLNQVFINLVLNSVQAIEGEGIIRISAKVRDKYLIFEIADTGRGINSNDLKNIFKPYFTNKSSGTGLGCYISKTLIEDLGGEIKVFSQEGKGTVFTILFKDNFFSIENQRAEVLPNEEPVRVLLVDDDENVREVLRMGLNHDGFLVEPADGYDLAISLAKTKKFDVAVVDIIMPGRSGYETAKDLLDIQPNLKIIVISGYSPPETISSFQNLGVSTFLQKPFAISELSAAIRNQIK